MSYFANSNHLISKSYIDQKRELTKIIPIVTVNIIKHLNMFSLLQVLKYISAWQCLYIFASVTDSNHNQREAHKKVASS